MTTTPRIYAIWNVLRFLRLILRHRAEFTLGYREAHSSEGMTYDDDPWSDRSYAYDLGRNLRLLGQAA